MATGDCAVRCARSCRGGVIGCNLDIDWADGDSPDVLDRRGDVDSCGDRDRCLGGDWCVDTGCGSKISC
jgi:hypothetical protein